MSSASSLNTTNLIVVPSIIGIKGIRDAASAQARGELLRMRDVLDQLAELWNFARIGGSFVTPVTAGRRIDDHVLWDLGPRRSNKRIWRIDGQKNARSIPLLRLGASGMPDGSDLALHGRLRPGKHIPSVPYATLLAHGCESIDMARACIDAILSPQDPQRVADAMGALSVVAHEEAARREATPHDPPHLTPAVITLAATPWSDAQLKLRLPHVGRDKLANRRITRILPQVVDLTISDQGLVLAPHRMVASGRADPITRLRALADIERLAPFRPASKTPRRRKSAAP